MSSIDLARWMITAEAQGVDRLAVRRTELHRNTSHNPRDYTSRNLSVNVLVEVKTNLPV